ncbi:hypothetical protein DV736_g2637, partial [Chaetothyriales sp. CBS 134916]
MAPVDILTLLKERHFRHHGQDKPIIDTSTATFLSMLKVIFTLLYVVPFYLSPTTRPSPTLNRDAPSVIRARIRTVTLACLISSAAIFGLLVLAAKVEASEALHLLGYWPISLFDILRACLLTILLFLGPLFEILLVDRAVGPESGRQLVESLSSWQGYRNFIASPITEEAVFRSVLVPIHLLAKISLSKVVFLTPLYFGIAHIHHFYEFTLTHPHTPLSGAVLRSLFQFGYTTIFGWLATFIYVRTASLFACILIHSLCNWIGFPRLWGKLEGRQHYPSNHVIIRGKEDLQTHELRDRSGQLGLEWTVGYYILLVLGAVLFYLLLWPLTASDHALAPFSETAVKSA